MSETAEPFDSPSPSKIPGALSHLCRVIYPARAMAYLLAATMLLQLERGGFLIHGAALCACLYPHLLQVLLWRFKAPADAARYSMLLDTVLVGVMVSLVGFNLEASAMLSSLLAISVLIVGGPGLFAACLTVFLGVTGMGYLLLAPGLVGGESFYFVSLLSILLYAGLVGILVFRETHRLNSAQRQANHLSKTLIEFKRAMLPFLPRTPGEVQNGPQRKRLTVLFVDLEGFTDLMDTGNELIVARLLNEYFAIVSALTLKFGGTVDKFIGDGAMVYFGDPKTRGAAADALAAVSMALGLRSRFSELAHTWQLELRMTRPLRIRIGIHTGYCLVGEFGCPERKDFTAVGSTVNRASRLEAYADGGEILMSAATRQFVGRKVRSSDRGSASLKGIVDQMQIYAVEGLSNPHPEIQPRLLG